MRRHIALCIAIAVAACSADAVIAPSVAGTYALTKVNGAPLPVTTSALLQAPAQIVSATLVLATDGSFTSELNVIQMVGGVSFPTTLPTAGRYVVSGQAITFTARSDGSVTTGTLTGGTLIAPANGLTFTFERR